MHEGRTSMMHHEDSMPELWELLNDEQKRKMIAMKLEMKIQWMEMKIEEMQKIIEAKKKSIANIRQVQEMIKTGK